MRAARFTGAAVAVAAAVVFTGVTPAQAAEGVVLGTADAGTVAGSYIVVLKDSAKNTDSGDLARRYSGTVGRIYTQNLAGFSVRLDEKHAKRLAADNAVAFVEQDKTIHTEAVQQNPPSWGLDRVDQRNLPLNNQYTYSTTASNVNVYVLDTGIRATHQTFGGRVHQGYDFVDNDSNADDGYGHGTHVAATIAGSEYGVAKGAQLYPVRVLGSNGSGTISGVIAGVNWITSNAKKPAVANASLGGGVSTALDTAVRNSISSGVTWAVAAGNSNANASTSSPARVAEAITVAAADKTDTRASFSNYGAGVDLFAPGVGITSAWNTNDTATYTGNGTSFASPHVAGAAAIYLATHPTATAAQVSQALVAAATPNLVKNPGSGTPNRTLYIAP
ncbi:MULTISPECIES: S8 family peptidase [unclassified Amycolatopsis]|uniref:S8 family peptidase n=1 Tax=unclassified Amycolatopsis TaxID=2618356 RepID=UPI0028746F50|nr:MULTISPECIES: S8 family peptidase [unclassified Amycolatopsis]MDS0135798.1 S8 family peptidase [Amycolatopsis sp. 505]MDS0145601.1 S8 family peptidase [Amycolatopsis sp. CM201R]